VGALAMVLLLLLSADALAQKKQTVKLVINYGDGVQKHFTALAWREGMTVLDAMKLAREHARGIKFEYSGSGASAFLSAIDGVGNEGGGRNWIYRVNGSLGDRSFGSKALSSGDEVSWTFGTYGDE
jgi:hypothetical protein